MQGDGPLAPWEILQFTFPELRLKLRDPKNLTKPTGSMSDAEIAAYSEWYMGLDNRKRLELARRGEL